MKCLPLVGKLWKVKILLTQIFQPNCFLKPGFKSQGTVSYKTHSWERRWRERINVSKYARRAAAEAPYLKNANCKDESTVYSKLNVFQTLAASLIWIHSWQNERLNRHSNIRKSKLVSKRMLRFPLGIHFLTA